MSIVEEKRLTDRICLSVERMWVGLTIKRIR